MTSPALSPDPLAELRFVSRDVHRSVDDAFSGYDLSVPQSYVAMLRAHERALTVAEQYLAGCVGLPEWRERRGLVAADLALLGETGAIHPVPFDIRHGTPEGWGVLYVLEGSRLGGQVLARRVGAGMPRAYLSAGHEPGGWNRFLGQLRTYLAGLDAAGRARVTRAVVATFALYRVCAQGVSV